MNNYSFRDYHLLQLINTYQNDTAPLDVAICHYFRQNKALGSKDRHAIAEAAYGLIRWQRLLEALAPGSSWLDKLHLYQQEGWRTASGLPAAVLASFPDELYARLCTAYGAERGHELCLISNTVAPTCVRVNSAKISRDALLERWQGSHQVKACQQSPDGIIFKQKIHFYSLPEFREGLFEVQDEGSQLLANLVAAQPGDLVLDYCAGAGGKALAIAPRLQGRGQLLLHDIRDHALIEARQRLKRAGIQNCQTHSDTSPVWPRWKKKMDWVLVDAPCSGTGTLRRNPDMKWRFDTQMLQRLVGQQRTIFERALSYVKPGGHIVYATCSLLPEENELQAQHFQKTYNLTPVEKPWQTFPSQGGMDGFFGAVFHT